ncbi:FecR family protein [Chitinophaga niastensis]|uniref:FecR family protein n=1 Tax=Chitinophaga niastensis TaxID=536980 RepID=A0A2P8HP13_CHINA|nr:FecR family protein [Chitinophaga niastensis]PSL47954.1 FecR family protein [Chitinophaga niastensis]
MSQYEFDDLLEKYLAGLCSPQEEKVVLEWYKSFINESEIALSSEEKQDIESKIWSNVYATVNREPVTTETPVIPLRPRKLYRLAIAGCAALLVAAGWYWASHRSAVQPRVLFTQEAIPKNYSFFYNEENKNREVTLNDGSIVQLQPGGAVYYPEMFSGKTRDVYLSGNAFFQITHDSTKHFIVHTEEGIVAEVLGTSFYVIHDKKTSKVEVSVVTGKVSVYERKKKNDSIAGLPANSIIITPNQKVTFKPENNQFVTSLVDDPKPVISATNGVPPARFIFEETSLDDVLATLEGTYAITIETDNQHFSNCHFTGDITKQNLYEKLDIICESIQASYEVKGTTIYIKGKGCN